jgi:hypothetical protein
LDEYIKYVGFGERIWIQMKIRQNRPKFAVIHHHRETLIVVHPVPAAEKAGKPPFLLL